jgi:MFS family permease
MTSLSSGLGAAFPIGRIGVSLAFLVHGLVMGSWIAQIPRLKEGFGVGAGAFSFALLAIGVGAILNMPIAGGLIGRFGARRVMLVGLVALPAAFAVLCAMPSLLLLAIVGFAFGAASGGLDVAMNALGVQVEKALGRPVLSGLHGLWSVGSFVGAALGGLLLGGMSGPAHAVLIALIALSTLPVVRRVADEGGAAGGAMFALPSRATFGAGMLCFLVLVLEGAVMDWAGVFLRAERGHSLETAPYGFVAFGIAMAASRFMGDALRHRFGATRVVMVSGLVATAGMLIAVLSPTLPLILLGFAVCGLGVGNIGPILFGAGGALEPSAPGRGIAAVTTMGYGGFLIGPPLVGFLAEGVDFGFAFLVLGSFGLIVTALWRPIIGRALG